jgi:hypothetical protein
MDTLAEFFARNPLDAPYTDEELGRVIAAMRERRKQLKASKTPKFSSLNKLNAYIVEQIGAALARPDEDAIKAIRELFRDEYEPQAKLLAAKAEAKAAAQPAADQPNLDLDEHTPST